MKTVFVYEHLSGGAADAGAVGDGLEDADAAALRAAGSAMRDAVVADLQHGRGWHVVFAARGDAPPAVPPPPGSPRPAGLQPAAGDGADDASEPPTVVPRPGESAVDFVRRQSTDHDLTWVIAPETAGLLGRLCGVVEPARWLGCDAGAIALAGSKRATLERLAEHGVCTPLDFETTAAELRWVVKPDDGAGALATRRHRSQASAMADAAARPGGAAAHVVEPWVEGHPMSLSLLCGAQGAVELLSVNRQSIRVDATGRVDFERVDANVLAAADPRAAPLHALARRIGEAIGGLRGFVGVDLVWHAQRGPVVIEVNPRLTSAYVGLPALLGRRLAAEVVAAHTLAHDDGRSDASAA